MKSIKSLRRVGVIHDLVVAALAFLLAHSLTLGLARTIDLDGFAIKIAAFTLVSALVFHYFSLNRGSWHYASLPDLVAISKASAALAIAYTVSMFLIDRAGSVPRSVPFNLVLLLIVLLGAPRLFYRLYRESAFITLMRNRIKGETAETRFVLVHTLNESAEQFIRATRIASRGGIVVAGLIDDRPERLRDQVQGVRVLGSTADLGTVLKRLQKRDVTVAELVVADDKMAPSGLTALTEAAIGHGLKISKLPDFGARRDLTAGGMIELKPINLSDLLGRSEVRIDIVRVARLIEGKNVLITGAGGSIGSELARQIASFRPAKLLLADNSEFMLYRIDMGVREAHPDLDIESLILDVRDARRCDAVIGSMHPDVIFHAAALKHVPMVENNPLEGMKTNVLGTMNLANAATLHGVKTFVMISTDKAVNPTNVMGATKRAAEAYCQAADLESKGTRFKTVRFGNVLGSNGSVVPRFREQIARGGPVTVTHPEIVRYFMSIPEAVRLVLQASGHGLNTENQRGKILVLDMGEPVKIDDLARKMIYLAGLKPGTDIKIVYTGLRPGEKLFEELFAESEPIELHDERGYSIAAPRTINASLLRKSLAEMRAACDRQDPEKALAVLRHIVPEFRSAGSARPLHQPALVNPLPSRVSREPDDAEF